MRFEICSRNKKLNQQLIKLFLFKKRVCCQAQRGFQINIIDNLNTVVMRISREFKCCAGCCWFAGCCDACAHEIVVEAPIGNVVGYVKQNGSFWKASYDILDANHELVLQIGGPCCILDGACCPFDNNFDVCFSFQ